MGMDGIERCGHRINGMGSAGECEIGMVICMAWAGNGYGERVSERNGYKCEHGGWKCINEGERV